MDTFGLSNWIQVFYDIHSRCDLIKLTQYEVDKKIVFLELIKLVYFEMLKYKGMPLNLDRNSRR